VGAGTHFLSGISYYTLCLVNALAPTNDVSAVLMRRLLPARLYPGRHHVGSQLTQLRYAASVDVCDGVDWYWLPSMVRALTFLRARRPQALVFQWWTAAVLHSYLALAIAARRLGARVIVEFHEVQDPGEERLLPARAYARLVAPHLMRLADAFVIHSAQDREALAERYALLGRPVVRIAHGPYDQYNRAAQVDARPAPAAGQPNGHATDDPSMRTTEGSGHRLCNLLFFGVIRPYKGLEDLIRAFDALPPDQIGRYRLTVVGETWEGWTLPAELIAASRYRDRITFVNRYVPDREASGFFAVADVAVLPYRRSSASGPLQAAMSCGLPIVTTHVGGLPEAVAGYEGAILVPPGDVDALCEALPRAAAMAGRRYRDPHSWAQTAASYAELFAALGVLTA
jgi:glycosyltransferase involved in cell wall biosynthesis